MSKVLEIDQDLGPFRHLDLVGNLLIDGVSYRNVVCRVFVPDRDSGEIRCEFDVYGKNKLWLMPGSGRFQTKKIHLGQAAQFPQDHFELEGLHISSVQHVQSKNFRTAIGTAYGLHIVRLGKKPEKQGLYGEIRFVSSPNKMLQPFRMDEVTPFGNFKRTHQRGITLSIKSLGRLQFDFFYDWLGVKGSDTPISRRSISIKLTPKVSLKRDSIQSNLLPAVDDLLLLASFGPRIPTRCTGWIGAGDSAQVEFYRRDIYLAPAVQRFRTITNGGLVSLSDFPEFLRTTHRYFERCDYQKAIRSSIFALLNSADETIEKKITSLFSAVEGLISSLTSDEASTHAKAKSEIWKKSLEPLLTAIDQLAEKGEIDDLAAKDITKRVRSIPGLSFSMRLEIALKKLELDISDLWPLVSSGNTQSLYMLRNKIVHGGTFNTSDLDALVVAGHHMEWVLERMLCAALGWPIEDTDVGPFGLQGYWLPHHLEWGKSEKKLRGN